MTAVRSLLTLDGKLSRPSPEEVRALGGRRPEAPYWLDIQDPAEEDYRLLLDDYRGSCTAWRVMITPLPNARVSSANSSMLPVRAPPSGSVHSGGR